MESHKIRKILRCTPDHFDVTYVINPHMRVGTVVRSRAREQWELLGAIYKELGVETQLISSEPGLPDMIFAANLSIPFTTKEAKKAVIMANMAFPERKGEVSHYKTWFEENGYETVLLPEHLRFEGMGDVFYHKDRSFLWGAYGFRTDEEAHRGIEKITGLEVRSLQLVDPAFYHLDTCLCPLTPDSAIVLRSAFDDASFKKLQAGFSDLIELTSDEAYNFTGNAHCPDQKHVILQKGSPRIEAELIKRGLKPIPVETDEYIKSGGSVTCLRLELE